MKILNYDKAMLFSTLTLPRTLSQNACELLRDSVVNKFSQDEGSENGILLFKIAV